MTNRNDLFILVKNLFNLDWNFNFYLPYSIRILFHAKHKTLNTELPMVSLNQNL